MTLGLRDAARHGASTTLFPGAQGKIWSFYDRRRLLSNDRASKWYGHDQDVVRHEVLVSRLADLQRNPLEGCIFWRSVNVSPSRHKLLAI